MIIAHVADIHLDSRPSPYRESLDEQVERLLWIGEDAAAHGAQMMLVAGDLYDRTSTVSERNAAVTILTSWAWRMPIAIVYGNHDAPDDLEILGRLGHGMAPIWVQSRPHVIDLSQCAPSLAIAFLPWPRKAWLAAQAGIDARGDLAAAARQQMRGILSGFSAEFERFDGPRILLAHAELGGSVLDSGQPLTGRADIELSPADFAECDADYVALGHIHNHQIIDGRYCYAGSTRQTAFGQSAAKGYCLVDVERGRAPFIELRTAPGRELHTVEVVWSPSGALSTSTGAPVASHTVRPGDIYRLSYTVEEGHRWAAAEQAATARTEWLAAGAHSVKIDPRVIAATRVRSEEIQTASTTAERLAAWRSARGDEDLDTDRLTAKLAQLDVEVHS